MPSAATIKPSVVELVSTSDSTAPLRQIMTAVEHKIRNLEKRKGKLEGYQDLRKSGKDLSTDQDAAVSKYAEVVQCLLCAQELLKQIQSISNVWDKEQKKNQRKEVATRVAGEVSKVRETLVLQDLLRKLKHTTVREDFLTGSNGAVKLEEADMALIDKLVEEGSIAMEGAESVETYEMNAHKAADHWVSTVDGKPKQFVPGVTYEHVRRIVRSVQDCGYFNRCFVNAPTTKTQVTHTSVDEELNPEGESTPSMVDGGSVCGDTTASDVTAPTASQLSEDQRTTTTAQPTTLNPIPVLQGAGVVPLLGTNAPVAGQQEQQQHRSLPAVDNNNVYFNGFPKPPQPPLVDPNSLPEELETGSFSFLQESELDELGNVTVSNSHVSPIPPPTVIPTQQQQQQPNSLMLINSMVPMTYSISQPIPPGANLPLPDAAVAAAAANSPSHLNQVQHFMKTLNAANFHQMLQQQQQPMTPQDQQSSTVQQPDLPSSAAVPMGSMISSMNGSGPRMTSPPRMNAVSTGPNYGMETELSKPPGLTDRTSPLVIANGSADQMTISEWKNEDAVGRPEDKTTEHNHPKRETSAESSGDRRRGDDRRPRQNGHDRGSNTWNNGGGSDMNNGGYNSSRRRFYDRPNGGTYNGSRMQQQQQHNHHRNGGPIVDGAENGTSGNSPSYRSGGPGKPHFNSGRMNGGGYSNGGGGNGGAGGGNTFYRNNDPTFYQQNGAGGGKPSRQSNGMGGSAGTWKSKVPHRNGVEGQGYNQSPQVVGGASGGGPVNRN